MKTLQQETVFTDGSDYFKSIFNDIENAQHSIDIEMYIFEKDLLGLKLAEHLKEAAKRGVSVRLLVDGAGSPLWGGDFVTQLENAGIQTRIFHPYPWQLWQWGRSMVRVPFLLKAFYLLLKINSRSHRKYFLIDKKIAYISSANVCKCHLHQEEGGDHWRDAGVRLEENDLSPLTHAFTMAWHHKHIKERIRELFKHIHTDPVIRLNNTRHRRRVLYKDLLRHMKGCKKRIWITNAYFVPDNFLLKRLKAAAQSGIDVRILLPKDADVHFMPWASTTFYASLLKRGVRIFEYLPSMLHAKTLIIDDWVLVGSSNLNHRSLLHDLEVDIRLELDASKKILEEQFLKDIRDAIEILLNNWQKRPLHQRIIGRLLLYLKYWI